VVTGVIGAALGGDTAGFCSLQRQFRLQAAVFVEELKGSYSGVVGLPLCETAALLSRCGVGFWLTARAPL